MTHTLKRPRWRRAAVALSAAAVLVGIAGCGSDTSSSALTWYINPDAGGQVELAKKCTEEAGGEYTINTSVLPLDAAGQREQLIRRLASQDKSIDIMSLDPVFVAEMAQAEYIVPVPTEYQQEFTDDVVASSVESSTWKDELIAAPFWANTQILWYRKSVAEEAGLDMTKPVTWDQVIEAAKAQEKEIGVQGVKAEALTVWINALVESSGGTIVDNPEADADQVKLGLDTEAGKRAAEIVSTIGTEGLGGPALENQDENGAMLRFQSDSGGFMVNWPFVYAATAASVEEGTVDQAVLDDIGWAIYPQTVEGTEARPPLGGINLAVSAYSTKQDAAFKAIECIRTAENQAEYFVTNGNPPAKSSAFNDAAVQKAFPMAAEIQQSLKQSAARPLTPYYNEVTGGLQDTWHPVSKVNPDRTPSVSGTLITEIMRGERLL